MIGTWIGYTHTHIKKQMASKINSDDPHSASWQPADGEDQTIDTLDVLSS